MNHVHIKGNLQVEDLITTETHDKLSLYTLLDTNGTVIPREVPFDSIETRKITNGRWFAIAVSSDSEYGGMYSVSINDSSVKYARRISTTPAKWIAYQYDRTMTHLAVLINTCNYKLECYIPIYTSPGVMEFDDHNCHKYKNIGKGETFYTLTINGNTVNCIFDYTEEHDYMLLYQGCVSDTVTLIPFTLLSNAFYVYTKANRNMPFDFDFRHSVGSGGIKKCIQYHIMVYSPVESDLNGTTTEGGKLHMLNDGRVFRFGNGDLTITNKPFDWLTYYPRYSYIDTETVYKNMTISTNRGYIEIRINHKYSEIKTEIDLEGQQGKCFLLGVTPNLLAPFVEVRCIGHSSGYAASSNPITGKAIGPFYIYFSMNTGNILVYRTDTDTNVRNITNLKLNENVTAKAGTIVDVPADYGDKSTEYYDYYDAHRISTAGKPWTHDRRYIMFMSFNRFIRIPLYDPDASPLVLTIEEWPVETIPYYGSQNIDQAAYVWHTNRGTVIIGHDSDQYTIINHKETVTAVDNYIVQLVTTTRGIADVRMHNLYVNGPIYSPTISYIMNRLSKMQEDITTLTKTVTDLTSKLQLS